MKHLLLFIGASLLAVQSFTCDKCGNYNNDDFQIKKVSVKHSPEIGEITTK